MIASDLLLLSIATTPRDKLLKPKRRSQSEKDSKDRAFPSSSAIDEEEEEHGSERGSRADFAIPKFKKSTKTHRLSGQKDHDSIESHIKEQFIYFRMDSVTKGSKRQSETTNTIFQRAASIRTLRDPSFSEFSFKHNMDSSCERDGESLNSQPSSRRNMGSASNRSAEQSMQKFDGPSFGGLRRTATPNFNKPRPSAFLMEKRYSMRNLRVGNSTDRQISSATSIIPHDLKEQVPRETGITLNAINKPKGTNSLSIDDTSNSLYPEAEGKRTGNNISNNISDKWFDSPEATLKSEDFTSPYRKNSPKKLSKKIAIETLGKMLHTSQESQLSELGKTAGFITTVTSGEIQCNQTKEVPKPSAADSEATKQKLKAFEQQLSPPKILPQANAVEKENENNTKEPEQNLSITNTNLNQTTATSADVLGLTKDTSVGSKTEQNPMKIQLPFIRRVVDPMKSQRPTACFAGDIISGISVGSIKESPHKDLSQAQESPMQKNSFQKKLFPGQLSVQAKFTKNLLDLLKDQPEDFSPVLPLSHKNRQQSKNSRSDLSERKNTVQSIDYGNSQTTLPTNLLTITRQDTLTETNPPKNPVLFPVKLLRKGTQETLPGGASPLTLHNRLFEQEYNSRHPPQTMRTDYSTFLDNRTIYNPGDDISAINITKYAFNYDNEDIEFDENAVTSNSRSIIPQGLLNQSSISNRESTPPIRFDNGLGFNRKDSLASTGKNTNTYKGYQPNDGFESHLQQMEEGSPMESKMGSKTSIGSATHIPKPDLKQNPHRPLKDSAFRTTPRDLQLHLLSQNSLKLPAGDSPNKRNYQKARSCVINPADGVISKEELPSEEPSQSQGTAEVDAGKGNTEIISLILPFRRE